MHPTRVAPTSTSTHAPDRFAPDRFAPDRFAARRTWNRGHVRGCPHNPLDWWRSLEMQALVRFTGKSLDELVAAARPGDLLLMSGRGVLAFVQEKFSASRWSHVGLVCRYRGELCVAHATPHGHGANLLGGAGDVRVTPLHPFLREYLDDIGLDVALRRLAGLDETDAGAERDRVNAAIVATAEECRAMRFEPNAGAFVAVRYPALGALIALGLAGLAAVGARLPTTMVHDHHRFIWCTDFYVRCYIAAGLFAPTARETQFIVAPGDVAASPVHTVLDIAACDCLPWAEPRFFYGPPTYVN